MLLKETAAVDYVAWAKRANARWLVHHDLGKNAEAYLNHLAQNELKRLVPSCRNAYLMVWMRDSTEDPKPWFYGGLFSLATPEEIKTFLANHWLTRIVVSPPETTTNAAFFPDGIAETTAEKIRQLRESIGRLPDA